MSTKKEHILLLGATGATGLVFLDHIQKMPGSSRPKVTAYIRSRSKIPASIGSDDTIRIVEGALDDEKALDSAMQSVTVVISFLGAYLSLSHAIFRHKPTPIADSFPTVFSAMGNSGVRRIMALSTPTAFPQIEDTYSWKWWFYTCIPILFAPQGNAEMKGIAEQVSARTDLEWTVLRVPHLNDGEDAKVAAGMLGLEYQGSTELSRQSLVRWTLDEVEKKEWIRGVPMLGNY